MENLGAPFAGKSRGKKLLWGGIIIIAAVLVLVAVDFLFYNAKKYDRLSNWIDMEKYQAVFLSNGQVYFGRVADITNATLLLSDVYYLKTVQNLQSSEGAPNEKAEEALDAQKFSLIKLGSEIHGPDGSMSINLEHILFVENLKPDSKVVQAIGEYEKKK